MSSATLSLTTRCTTLLWALNNGQLATAARLLDNDEPGASAIDAAIRRVPPVCDVSREAIEAAVTTALEGDDELVLGLPDATGAVVLEIRLLWGIDSAARMFPDVSLALHEVNELAAAEWRPVDARGRLPAEQFVGTSSWRLGRLFTTLASPFDAVDNGPRSDLEAAWLLQYADGDIYNGGLHQFYSNSTGNFSGEFPAFAARIGAPVKARAVEISNTLFAGLDLRDRWARTDRLDALSGDDNEALDGQTSIYYDADEPIDDLLARFVEINPDEFLY